MLYYTACFLFYVCDIFDGMGGGCTKKQGIHFRHKEQGREKLIVPRVVKLRHANVLVSRQYPRKKPVSGMHSSRYRTVCLVFFFPESESLEKYRRCALLLLWSLTLLLWSFAGQVHAVVLVRN